MVRYRNEITVKITYIIQRTYLSLENGRLETSSSCDWGLELGDLNASPGRTCHHQKEHIPSLPSGYYYCYYYYYY